jgi:hypothetical protein
MKNKHQSGVSRRTFVKSALVGTVAASVDLGGFPSIVPSSVFGATAPSNRINIGAIGNGRISRGHDLPGVWRYDEARIMAVCDLDSHRAEDARVLVNDYYSKKTGTTYNGVTVYTDYRQLLQNGHRRGVISTQITGIRLSALTRKQARPTCKARFVNHCRRSGRVMQFIVPRIFSWQSTTFVNAVSLRRNWCAMVHRLLKTVSVGLPADPAR